MTEFTVKDVFKRMTADELSIVNTEGELHFISFTICLSDVTRYGPPIHQVYDIAARSVVS